MYRLGTLSDRLTPHQQQRRSLRLARRRGTAVSRDPLAHVIAIPIVKQAATIAEKALKGAVAFYAKLRKGGVDDKRAVQIASARLRYEEMLAEGAKIKRCGFQQPRGLLGSFRAHRFAPCDGALEKKSAPTPDGRRVYYTCKKCGRERA